MFFCHQLRPFFNCATLYLYGISAIFTYEVMMVGISAETIDSLTIITSQDVDDLVA